MKLTKQQRQQQFVRSRRVARRVACKLAGGHVGDLTSAKRITCFENGKVTFTNTHCTRCGTWID